MNESQRLVLSALCIVAVGGLYNSTCTSTSPNRKQELDESVERLYHGMFHAWGDDGLSIMADAVRRINTQTEFRSIVESL